MRVSFIYCLPGVLDSESGRIGVDHVLEQLALELGHRDDPTFRRSGSSSIVVPDAGPEEVWTAMDRISSSWSRQGLFFVPEGFGHGMRAVGDF
jgi:hypothetical protein